MPGCKGSAEESDGAGTLVKHRAKAGARRVAVHGERLLEVRKMQHRGNRQGLLEGVERRGGLVVPREHVFPEQLSEGRGNGPDVLNKAAIEPRRPRAERGGGQDVTAATLSWSMATPSEMTWPRYATVEAANEHLLRLTRR